MPRARWTQGGISMCMTSRQLIFPRSNRTPVDRWPTNRMSTRPVDINEPDHRLVFCMPAWLQYHLGKQRVRRMVLGIVVEHLPLSRRLPLDNRVGNRYVRSGARNFHEPVCHDSIYYDISEDGHALAFIVAGCEPSLRPCKAHA